AFLIILLILLLSLFYVFVCSALHTFITTYTEISEGKITGIPKFFAIKKLIPRQDWMKEFASGDRFKEYTEIKEQVQQIYKINIHFLMEQFNHSHGVHTYQRTYGCDWDDQTRYSRGLDQYGYDGEDFISLDMKKFQYITHVPQGLITTVKWNNNTAQLEFLKQYYQLDCVNWLKYLLMLRKVDLERRASEVSLLQKDPSSPVECHATGFYPAAVTITWLKNGQEHYEDVDFGETLPNVDGTFQKASTLSIRPEELKMNQFVCVVEHEGRAFQKILTDDEIKSNTRKLLIVVFTSFLKGTTICSAVPKHEFMQQTVSKGNSHVFTKIPKSTIKSQRSYCEL
uniref:Ig-like domain-containing protein n=1 Tax=Sinocyclocheilus anshuiensis TaxID=1608454 RepID=A0A671PQU4_9TELE